MKTEVHPTSRINKNCFCHGEVNNPLNEIKEKDKSKYIVYYGNISFRADDEISIERMAKKGILPDEVVSIDGNEHYYLSGICM